MGFFNRVLTMVGLPAFSWLSSSDTALVTLVGISAWKSIGLFVVILTAGMLNIPGRSTTRHVSTARAGGSSSGA